MKTSILFFLVFFFANFNVYSQNFTLKQIYQEEIPRKIKNNKTIEIFSNCIKESLTHKITVKCSDNVEDIIFQRTALIQYSDNKYVIGKFYNVFRYEYDDNIIDSENPYNYDTNFVFIFNRKLHYLFIFSFNHFQRYHILIFNMEQKQFVGRIYFYAMDADVHNPEHVIFKYYQKIPVKAKMLNGMDKALPEITFSNLFNYYVIKQKKAIIKDSSFDDLFYITREFSNGESK